MNARLHVRCPHCGVVVVCPAHVDAEDPESAVTVDLAVLHLHDAICDGKSSGETA